ncbi:MAG: hypothetical protein ABIE94_04285 [archaeon]
MKHKEADHLFHLKGGGAVKTLGELMDVLEHMTNAEFDHHVMEDRNDFATWTEQSLHNKKLADKMWNAKTKDALLILLEHELEEKKEAPKMLPDMPKKPEEPKPVHMHEKHEHETQVHAKHPQERAIFHGITPEHGKFVVKEFIYGLIFGVVLGLILGKIVVSGFM